MSLWKIAWRSIQQRSLSSTLTGLSMALGVALVILVIVIHGVIREQFRAGGEGYHLIVGAKGGKLQLVLNTVYHLSQPIENIPYSYYKEFLEGKFASVTEFVIPCCMGDSYRAGGQTFRVVGTTPDMFERIEFGAKSDGTRMRYTFQPGGRNFKQKHFFEAVIGSVVAHTAGLKVGDTFRPAHDIVEEGDDPHEHDAFTIVGVLQPSGTPNDRAIFVNIEGFYLLEGHAKHGEEKRAHGNGEKHDSHGHESHGHDHHGHAHREPLPESEREVTALLVKLEGILHTQQVFTQINEAQVAQAVMPVREVEVLFERFVAPIQTILLALSVLIVIVAGIGILVSIYNSMNERSHEIAVMRALGAGRGTVMSIVLLESILLSLAGGLAGVVLGHGMIALVAPYVVNQTGVSLSPLQFNPMELALIPSLMVLATLAGFLPSLSAYRTDVAKALTARP